MGRLPAADRAERSRPFVPAPQRFLDTAARRGTAPAYYVREEKGWVSTPWNDYRDEVRQAARALVALGVKPGDAVAVLAYNRPEWVIVDIAAMMIGASVAGIYFTSSPQDIAYIIGHAHCEIVIAEKQEYFKKIEQERANLNVLRHVVMMKGAQASGPLQMTWEEFLSRGESRFDAEAERRLRAIQPGGTGCLIYTSGTTGPPKAVQLSHGALAAGVNIAGQMLEMDEKDRMLSYLPLAHIAERILTTHFQLSAGNEVYFARSMLELGQHLTEVRPTIFFGVPRVFEKMASAAQLQIAQAKGFKERIARWAIRTGQNWHNKEQQGLSQGPKSYFAKAIASALVHKKAKRAMGLDRARLVFCGAAPTPPETLMFLNGLDIPIRELWGMSETTGAGSCNLPGATKIGSVGRPAPGIEIRIDADGEILVRSPTNFSGYAKDPDATARTIMDGWLCTGDLGRIDEDGFLHITGRKKDIIITSGGKNISPANLEMELAGLPLIDNAIVCGDRRPYLVALLTLNAGAVSKFASRQGTAPTDSRLGEAVREEIQTGIDKINARHSRAETIRRFAILPQPFSIESGELTPTLKIKRSAVLKKLETLIEELYNQDPRI
ncbi:MAG: AMP-dependent synthetase/ligase [Rhodomicrobium sp.]